MNFNVFNQFQSILCFCFKIGNNSNQQQQAMLQKLLAQQPPAQQNSMQQQYSQVYTFTIFK